MSKTLGGIGICVIFLALNCHIHIIGAYEPAAAGACLNQGGGFSFPVPKKRCYIGKLKEKSEEVVTDDGTKIPPTWYVAGDMIEPVLLKMKQGLGLSDGKLDYLVKNCKVLSAVESAKMEGLTKRKMSAFCMCNTDKCNTEV